MKILIIYYSRTGNIKKLAEALAEKLDANIGRIECPQFEGGAVRYMLAGYQSLTGKLPPIKLPPEVNNSYDLVLIGGPIWTSYPALPIRSFLRDHGDICANVGLFVTGGDPSPPTKALETMQSMIKGEVVASLSCNADEIADDSYMSKIDPFVLALGRHTGRRKIDRTNAAD